MSSDVLYYGAPVNRSYPCMRGIVSRHKVVPWYASGPRFIDLAARNHGTLTNGTAWAGARGRPGGDGSLSFDGTDDYVDVGTGVASTTRVTVWAWINKVNFADNHMIVCRDNAVFREYQFRTTSGANLEFLAFVGGSGVSAVGATTLSAGVWYFVAGVYDGASAIAYVNGKSDGTTAGAGNLDTGTDSTYLGKRDAGSPGNFFPGLMDEVGICGRALSQAEIRQLYDATSRRDDPTLSWIRPVTYFAPTAAAETTYHNFTLLGVGA